jgi:hypothetical protein
MMIMTRRDWRHLRLVWHRLTARTKTRMRATLSMERRTHPSTTRPFHLPSKGHSSSLFGFLGSCTPSEVRPLVTHYAQDMTICAHRGASDNFSSCDQGSSPVFGRCICTPPCASAFPRCPAHWEGYRTCLWVVCYARYVGIYRNLSMLS